MKDISEHKLVFLILMFIEDVHQCNRAILGPGVVFSPSLVQKLLHFYHFKLLDLIMDSTSICQMIAWIFQLLCVGTMRIQELALDSFTKQFFAALYLVHLYLDNAGGRFTFSLQYAGRDCMTLGGLLQPNYNELVKNILMLFLV